MSEARQRVAAAMGQIQQPQQPTKYQKLVNYFINDSIPAQMIKGAANAAYSGFMLPGDVYSGKTQLYGDDGRASQEVIDRSADLAGTMTLGAGAIPAQNNTLRMGIKAYHGSPHDFDKFSMGKIGTGEGAQAYGHGLYFADSEGTARFYRDELSGNTSAVTKSGIPLRESKKFGEWGSWVNSKFRGGAQPEEIADALRGMIAKDGASRFSADKSRYRRAMALADEIAAGNVRWKSDGRMYEVNINANPDDFLDWDMPLAGQSPSVRDAVRTVAPRAGGMDAGQRLLDAIAPNNATPFTSAADRARAASSAKLKEAGIPGIKYLDQGSRAAGDGSRNYVVFDENLIEIVRKYGIAGALAAGLLTEQQAAAFSEKERFNQAYAEGRGA